MLRVVSAILLIGPFVAAAIGLAQTATAQIPSGPLKFGVFTATFAADGSFTLQGYGWPTFNGSWTISGGVIDFAVTGVRDCDGVGRYRFALENNHVRFDVVADSCTPRRMILDRSTWAPSSETKAIAERRIVRTAADRPTRLPAATSSAGSWPSFRGPTASGVADKQNLPEQWNGSSGENILWKTPIPGLAHSSPIVWGDRVYVTTAISSLPNATFKPGLYGDGDASEDRSGHRWVIYALDKRSGKVIWERVAYEGEPKDKRHIKSTYASATPATDGRIVVASFGSQGTYGYDVNGTFLWKLDVGRLDLGAYDIPTYEWGPASSPIIWNGLVILQCDTQDDSFIMAVKAETGELVWKTERDELPSWATPTVITAASGPELVTNAANSMRAYDPQTGKELWRVGLGSKITAPTPIAGDGVIVLASGRAPERPIVAVRQGSRGDLTLRDGASSSRDIPWSKTGRGPYMPTPLIYGDLLYVLGNNGVFDAYEVKTGVEIYRQRLPIIGSGYSASPVAADGKIYLSAEDGEMLVIAAGREFKHVATNPIGDLLMATPAISDGVIYVRSASHLFAIGRRGR